ncbi:MAG: energy transducer TonB [Desulfomonilaceae bacterium]
MERLHSILHTHSRSPCAISPPLVPPQQRFCRPVAGWLGLQRRSPLYLEEDLLAEDSSPVFDACYLDATAFHTDVESDLDWEVEPSGSAFGDVEPALTFWDPVIDDSNLIVQPEVEHGCPLDQTLVLENDEFVAVFSAGLSQHRLVTEGFRFLALGSVLHLAALSLFIAAPTPSLPGFGGISEKPISVKLKEACEISTPDAPSPASVDSPASMGALARRNPNSEDPKTQKEIKKELLSEVEPEKVHEQTKTNSRLMESQPAKELTSAHQRVPPERSLKDDHPNDSRSSQDSIASMPSVASPERKEELKAGDEAQSYKDRILSAIHEAAYYPRAALRNMAYGKTVVCFTVNKDGSLANVAIVAHADSGLLDEAALKIVEKASSHFPPVPASLMKEQVSYVVPIVFKKGL